MVEGISNANSKTLSLGSSSDRKGVAADAASMISSQLGLRPCFPQQRRHSWVIHKPARFLRSRNLPLIDPSLVKPRTNASSEVFGNGISLPTRLQVPLLTNMQSSSR